MNGIFYIPEKKKKNILYLLILKKIDSFCTPKKKVNTVYIPEGIDTSHMYMATKFNNDNDNDNAVLVCVVHYDNMSATISMKKLPGTFYNVFINMDI